jgi:hypothetical protein
MPESRGSLGQIVEEHRLSSSFERRVVHSKWDSQGFQEVTLDCGHVITYIVAHPVRETFLLCTECVHNYCATQPDVPTPIYYWMSEKRGVLRPVIENYFAGRCLSHEEVMILRAYVRQWTQHQWLAEQGLLDRLLEELELVKNNQEIRVWLRRAHAHDVDPF